MDGLIEGARIVLFTSRLEPSPDLGSSRQETRVCWWTPVRAAKSPVAKRLEPARGTPGLEGLESARLVHNTRLGGIGVVVSSNLNYCS